MLHSVYWMLGAEALGIVYSDGERCHSLCVTSTRGSEQLSDMIVE